VYVYGFRDQGLVALDAATLGRSYTVPADVVWNAGESPDGEALAVCTKSGVLVVSPRTGKPLTPPLPHPDWVHGARFSEDGKHLLTACQDSSGRVWDWRASKVLATFVHRDGLFAAEFVRGERYVVTTSNDSTVRVWDARTGHPVTPALPLGGPGLGLTVTADGRRVIAGGFFSVLRIFDLDALTTPAVEAPDDLIRRAELLSMWRIDANGSPVRLNADEWMERWTQYRKSNPLPSVQP
jgi:WD40 repeat protein